MKRVISLLLILLFSQLSTASSNGIRVGIDPICPYFCEDENSNKVLGAKGYITELLEMFLKEEKLDLSFKSIPTPRHTVSLLSGLVDMILVDSNKIKFRQDIHMINIPLGISSFGIAQLKSDPSEIVDISDLKNRKFVYLKGIFADHSMHSEVGKLGNSALSIAGESVYSRLLRMLVINRVEVVGGDYYALKFALSQSTFKDKVQIKPTSFIGHAPIMLAVSSKFPKREQFSKKFLNFIQKLRENGKLSKLLAKYSLRDWSYKTTR